MSAKLLCLAIFGLALVQIGSGQGQGVQMLGGGQGRLPITVTANPDLRPTAVVKSEESFLWSLIMMPFRIMGSIFRAILGIFNWNAETDVKYNNKGHGYARENPYGSNGPNIYVTGIN